MYLSYCNFKGSIFVFNVFFYLSTFSMPFASIHFIHAHSYIHMKILFVKIVVMIIVIFISKVTCLICYVEFLFLNLVNKLQICNMLISSLKINNNIYIKRFIYLKHSYHFLYQNLKFTVFK